MASSAFSYFHGQQFYSGHALAQAVERGRALSSPGTRNACGHRKCAAALVPPDRSHCIDALRGLPDVRRRVQRFLGEEGVSQVISAALARPDVRESVEALLAGAEVLVQVSERAVFGPALFCPADEGGDALARFHLYLFRLGYLTTDCRTTVYTAAALPASVPVQLANESVRALFAQRLLQRRQTRYRASSAEFVDAAAELCRLLHWRRSVDVSGLADKFRAALLSLLLKGTRGPKEGATELGVDDTFDVVEILVGLLVAEGSVTREAPVLTGARTLVLIRTEWLRPTVLSVRTRAEGPTPDAHYGQLYTSGAATIIEVLVAGEGRELDVSYALY